jgi:hypothetical protein
LALGGFWGFRKETAIILQQGLIYGIIKKVAKKDAVCGNAASCSLAGKRP